MAYRMARIPVTLSEFEGHLLLRLIKRVARPVFICRASCIDLLLLLHRD